MIELPPRVKRVTETSVLRAVLVAVNRIPDVRAVRNNVGMSPCACKACVPALCVACKRRLTRPIAFGISSGSPDIVGIITLRGVACAFGLEVKVAARRNAHTERLRRQEAWRIVAGRRGMMCGLVTSVDEARAAVDLIRMTYSEKLTSSDREDVRYSPAD